jgi:hypothetical protein
MSEKRGEWPDRHRAFWDKCEEEITQGMTETEKEQRKLDLNKKIDAIAATEKNDIVEQECGMGILIKGMSRKLPPLTDDFKQALQAQISSIIRW